MITTNYEDKKRPPVKYSFASNDTNFTCTVPCTCKYIGNRSSYDIMQYNHLMLGKDMHLNKVSSFPGWNKNKNMLYNNKMTYLNQMTILVIHIIVALFIGYLSVSILYHWKIPDYVGYFLAFVVIGLLAAHSYFYVESRKTHTSTSALHGLNFDPNNPEYKPIGGVGGLGFE